MVLQHLLHKLEYLFPDRQINTEFSFPEPVYCNPDRIAQLASNLLANAFTHGNPESPVWFSAGNHNNILKLSVANDGENPFPNPCKTFCLRRLNAKATDPVKTVQGWGFTLPIKSRWPMVAPYHLRLMKRERGLLFSMSAKKQVTPIPYLVGIK